MSLEEQKRVEKLYDDLTSNNEYHFSCCECKLRVNPSDCHGCPVYAQSFSDD